MIKIGLIGCGSIAAHRHAPEIDANSSACIAGVYDIRNERAQILGKKYNTKVYKSLEQMLSDDTVDAVCVATTNATHADITIRALLAKKHVLCEKPMATTINDAISMIETAKKSGRYLMIGHNQRLVPAHIKAKEILKSGRLGRILTFSTTFGHRGPEKWSMDKGAHTWFFKKSEAFLGSMGDLGVHKTDLIRWLIDDDIDEVSAFVSTLDKLNEKEQLIDVDDNAVCILKSKRGVIGTLCASWTYYGQGDNGTEIRCTKGVMKLYKDPAYDIVIKMDNGDEEFYKVGAIATNEKQTASGISDMFINSILENEPPEISGEEGLKALEIVLACMKSQEEGRIIKI